MSTRAHMKIANNSVTLPRMRPDSMPAIHPLPEYLATGQIAQWYSETKEVLQVPWMGVVTMAFAHYPTFFGELWRGVGPICESTHFVHACRKLRDIAETRVLELHPAPLTARLIESGYAPREISAIKETHEIFSHGNQPYAIIATLARSLLESREIGTDREAEPFEGIHAPEFHIPFVLMEVHHADQQTRDLYDDIKTTLHLPFVNTDYRAFARWPSYFSLAWQDLKGKVDIPPHEEICGELHRELCTIVENILPNPNRLDSATLQAAAAKDASVPEIREVCRLFQWLLPGLITNVAYLRSQLRPQNEVKT